MKTTLITPAEPSKAPALPALYQAKQTGLIVVFNGPTKGTVLMNPSENKATYVGREIDDLVCFNDSKHWERLPAGFEIKHIQE